MNQSLCVFLVSCFAFVCFAGENLVRNGDFEAVNSKGVPSVWNWPGGSWAISTENVQSGTKSARYYNTVAGRYQFIYQEVPAKPGTSYALSALVKVVPLNGSSKNVNPRVFMEYYENGTFIGCEHAWKMVDLNTDWNKLTGTATVPANATRVLAGVFVGPEGTSDAKVWFDDVEVMENEAEDLFWGGITTDCYRNEASEGVVRVYCGCRNLPADGSLEARLEVLSGDVLCRSLVPDEIQLDRVIYSLDSDTLSPGKYTLEAILVKGGKTYKSQCDFQNLSQKNEYKTYVDKHHRMIVDGKPFFPLGMYVASVDEKDLKPYMDSKFNCLLPYTSPHLTGQQRLDYLWAHGKRIIYAINNLSTGALKGQEETKKRQAEGLERVRSWKDHPALLAWYINDEIDQKYLGDVKKFHEAVTELDPNHPTWSVLCRPAEFRSFLQATDILGSDPYPIPEKDISLSYKETCWTDDAMMGTKMIMMVPQTFCWGRFWVEYGYDRKKCENCPRPTFEQMDAMSWMCIAGGANGLIYYDYYDLIMRDEGVYDLPKISFAEHFGDCKRVAERIMAHEDVLLSIEKPLSFDITSNEGKEIAFRGYALEGTTWILAVNTNDKEERSFSLAFGQAVTLDGMSLSEADVQVDGGIVTGTLKPIESVFIKIKSKQ